MDKVRFQAACVRPRTVELVAEGDQAPRAHRLRRAGLREAAKPCVGEFRLPSSASGTNRAYAHSQRSTSAREGLPLRFLENPRSPTGARSPCASIRACKEMGISTRGGVLRPPTATPCTCRWRTRAICIGPASGAQDSYLNQAAILSAAVDIGLRRPSTPATAFLRKTPTSPRRARAAASVFIGPSAEVISPHGQQGRWHGGWPARPGRAAGATGVTCSRPPSRPRAEAQRIGCPVLIKARAGGGGRGIRRVDSPRGRWNGCLPGGHQARPQAAFGDGAVLHGEVAPGRPARRGAGAVRLRTATSCTLGERECSMQRRNQKLHGGEPLRRACPTRLRQSMFAAAARRRKRGGLRRARAPSSSCYTDAGELLLHGDEHPPAGGAPRHRDGHRHRPGQVAVARGRRGWSCPSRRTRSRLRGHAIECRINAETRDGVAQLRQGDHAARPQRPVGAL